MSSKFSFATCFFFFSLNILIFSFLTRNVTCEELGSPPPTDDPGSSPPPSDNPGSSPPPSDNPGSSPPPSDNPGSSPPPPPPKSNNTECSRGNFGKEVQCYFRLYVLVSSGRMRGEEAKNHSCCGAFRSLVEKDGSSACICRILSLGFFRRSRMRLLQIFGICGITSDTFAFCP